MWAGKYDGVKGCMTYLLNSSNKCVGYIPSAKYTKNKVFYFLYRRNCPKPDKKYLTECLREILGFKGKYLTVVEHYNKATTFEFYCFLDNMPTEEKMQELEMFLKTTDFSE